MSTNTTLNKHKFDIKIEEIDKHDTDGLGASWLTLKFSGNDFNIKMANSLRRAAANRIPTYAFPIELINIEKNNATAFNNDYMRMQLSTLPVIGMDPNIFHLDEKYWYDVNFADTNREKHKNEQANEFYLDFINETQNIVPVTTNNLTVHIDGELNNAYDKQYPILLIKERPKDFFKCHLKATLGIGDLHANWKAARSGYYDEIETSNGLEYVLTVEGNWQFSEYELMIRTCDYLVYKLIKIKENLEQKIQANEIEQAHTIDFVMPNEDHTLGEILNYEFQNHDDILGAGLTKPDHLIKSITFKVMSTIDAKSPLNAMLECIEKCANKFEYCGKLIKELSGNITNKKTINEKTINEKTINEKTIKEKTIKKDNTKKSKKN